MSFHQKIANLIDLMDYRQPFWKHVQTKNPSDEETKEPKGLAGLVEFVHGKALCKREQMSNWEKRPLRLS